MWKNVYTRAQYNKTSSVPLHGDAIHARFVNERPDHRPEVSAHKSVTAHSKTINVPRALVFYTRTRTRPRHGILLKTRPSTMAIVTYREFRPTWPAGLWNIACFVHSRRRKFADSRNNKRPGIYTNENEITNVGFCFAVGPGARVRYYSETARPVYTPAGSRVP